MFAKCTGIMYNAIRLGCRHLHIDCLTMVTTSLGIVYTVIHPPTNGVTEWEDKDLLHVCSIYSEINCGLCTPLGIAKLPEPFL